MKKVFKAAIIGALATAASSEEPEAGSVRRHLGHISTGYVCHESRKRYLCCNSSTGPLCHLCDKDLEEEGSNTNI